MEAIFGEPLPRVPDEVEAGARTSLGQLVIGNLAERVFETVYRDTVGTSDLRLQDDREGRGETDYLVFNGANRQVFRINIKFHGSLFRRAAELVGLRPEDCFALATYKIHAALQRQEAEHLPYIFVIVGVPGLTGALVGSSVPPDLVYLAALPRMLKRLGGVRQIEDQIVRKVTASPDEFGFREIGEYYTAIERAGWYVLSARRADRLLREKLFDRAFALRVPRFAQSYPRAELDMHFSLSEDLRPLEEFLGVLRDYGMPGLVSRLERGSL